MPDPLVAKEISDFQTLEMFNDTDRRFIERDNALTLFPRLKNKDEGISSANTPKIQEFDKFPLGTRIALSLMRKLMDKD